MFDELVFDDAEGSFGIMKYPLSVTHGYKAGEVNVVDASHKIICTVLDQEWGHTFARNMVRWANRWHSLRCWFRPYTREDWLSERNPKNLGGMDAETLKKIEATGA